MLVSLASLALLYLAALIIPGPNLLLLTHTAAASSRRSAVSVACGIATGTAVWVAVTVFGMQRIFDAAPILQTTLRVVGGVYLLYLAFGLLRSAWTGRRAPASVTTDVNPFKVQASLGAHYRRGLLTNLTNPKSLAFWSSVAVVSIDANAPLSMQLAAIAMVGTMALVWHVGLAFLFSTLSAQRAYLRAKPLLAVVTGCVMGAFGVRLLWSLRG